jgi:DNA-binding cell septation regulator SpoVG
MNMVNVKEDDIFVVHDIKVAIGERGSNNIYFFKEGKHVSIELENFVEMTRPIVKYLYEEGFVKAKSLKVTILSK